MDFLQEYIEEVKGILKDLENSMMTLEKDFDDPEEINNAYRFLHTIKGSAGMFEFHDVEKLAHELENIYSDIRDGDRQADNFVIDLTLHAVDILSDMIDGKDAKAEAEKLISDINELRAVEGEVRASGGGGSEGGAEEEDGLKTFAVIIKPENNIFKRGINFESILEELFELGKTDMIIHNESIPYEKQLAEKNLVSTFEVLLATENSEEDVSDVFLFMQENEYKVIPLRSVADFSNADYAALITIDEEGLERRITQIKELNPDFSMEATVEEIVEETAEEKEAKANMRAAGAAQFADDEDTSEKMMQRKSKKASTVSVATTKLDQMVNIVSELVIFRSEFQHLLDGNERPEISEALEKMERLILRLRDSAFNVRLVPLNVLTVKLQRLIRSVSQELGKEVDFITEGMDTELDRSMISALEAPLLHLIRNALDHGIESPELREKRNKPRKGLLKFYSYNSGDHVFIQIQDDGNGLNFEKIRKKAVEKGMIAEGQPASEKDLINLMMSPGFSTADHVSKVSGRGVGMDVVKKDIAAIRGDLEVSTEEELGSIFTIRLPLTLTILDTLVVNVNDSKYLIPISEVEFAYTMDHAELFKKKSRQVNYNGQLMPFVSLREYFEIEEEPPVQETVIIINKNDTRIAIVVDIIAGKLQTVYKPLNELLRPADCFSGASILGDGSMALILNALKLKS